MIFNCAAGFFVLAIGGFGAGALHAYYANNACDTYFPTCYSMIPAIKTIQAVRSHKHVYTDCISSSGYGKSKICLRTAQREYWTGIVDIEACALVTSTWFPSQQDAINHVNRKYIIGTEMGVGIDKEYTNLCFDLDEYHLSKNGVPREAAKAFVALTTLFAVFIVTSFVLCIIGNIYDTEIRTLPRVDT